MKMHNGFSINVIALFALAFWVHQQGAWRQKNEIQVVDLLKNQKHRIRRIVKRRTRTLNNALLAAQHANREQTRLMAYIGHDLRAPMASIVGYARMLGNTANSSHKKHIAAIERGANHQLVLIDELLEHVRGEFNLFGIKPVALDLRELIEDIHQHALTLVMRQHNRFVLELPEPLPHLVMLDGHRLSQVLLNLISNAAKFTKQGTITLSVTANHQGDTWKVSFELADTGTGIDAADQERIFGSFEQAQSLDGGLGLGLFIARSIVQNMGGRLTLRSTLGVGSAFRFEVIMLSVEPTSAGADRTDPAIKPAPDKFDPQWSVETSKPSPAALAKLTLLAAAGQWTDIQNWIVETSIKQPECGEFITIIESLLEDLEFDTIRELALP
jgi:signal transduction histidine kinase